MKIADSLKMFVGSVAVYAVVATSYACSDAAQPAKPGRTATAASSGGEGGASGASGAGGAAGSTSESVGAGPVPTAMADPVPGSRLQSRYRVAEDGSRQWLGWYDTDLDAPCTWSPMSDGKDHCVPVYAGVMGLYSDPGCTKRVTGMSSCASATIYKYAAIFEATECRSQYRFFRIEPLAPGTPFYQLNGNSCEVRSDLGVSDDTHRTVGAEVPPSEFVASDIVREP